VPELPTLLAESEKARALMTSALSERTAGDVARTPSVRPGATLAPTQTAMFEWITAGAEPVGAEALVHGGALSAEERVGIYSEMYWLRMRDALREDFPSIVRELGDEDFEVLVAKYLREHRSSHFSLAMAGRQMAAFLETMTVEGAPYLSSLAALERARTECFVAPDSAVLELAALQALASAFATARLVPSASLQVLTLSHDVGSRVSDGEANVEARKTHVVVWRRDWRVLHAEVAADEADALRRVLAGQGVAEVCEAFVEREDPASAAFAAIGSWVSEGMMAALET
jgi:hypothetical protein